MQKFYQLIHSEKYRIMSTSGIAAQITNPYSNDPILTIPSKTTGTTEEIIATREWVNSARINTSGTFTCTFKNSTYGTNFNGGYRLNLMDRTINITAGFGFNVANFPSSNSFNVIATGFPKPKFDTKVPIYYMRSSNYGAVAILYQDGSLGINRSGVSSPANDYAFIEWTYIGNDSYFS